MNTKTQVPPGEETQNPTPEVTDEKPEVVTPEEVEAKTDETPEEDDVQKSIKRLQRRIDKRTADVYRERARAEQLAAELERLRGGQTEEAPKESPKEDVNRLVEERAEAKLFAKTAEAIVETGKKSEPKFLEMLNDLRSEVGEFVQPNGLPSPFMKAVLDVADDPTKLMLHLAKNPDIAGDLADLPVTKLAARLDRLQESLKTQATPKQSSAPKPLEPIKPKSTGSNLPSDDDSIEVWMEKERARMKAKGLTRYG